MSSKTLLSLTAKLSADTTKFKSGLDKGKKQLGSFSKSIGKIGGLMAGAFAVGKVMQFGREAEAAYKIQAEAEIKLETVMRQRIKASDEEIESIKKMASAQQELGIIADEVILSGTQQIATFATQTSTLKTLMPAMNNLLAQQKGYAATAGDAVTIANLMGKALQGQVGALTRVGISFSKSQADVLKFGNETERAAVLAEVITSNVGEMNSALADSDLGVNQQVLNSWGDFQEKVGGIITSIKTKLAPAMNAMLQIASEGLEATTSIIDADSLKWWEKLLAFADGSGGAYRESMLAIDKYKKSLEKSTDETKENSEGTSNLVDVEVLHVQTINDLNAEIKANNELINTGNILDENAIAILNDKNTALKDQIKFLKSLTEEDLKRTKSPEKAVGIQTEIGKTISFDETQSDAIKKAQKEVDEYEELAKQVENITEDLSSSINNLMAGVISSFAQGVGAMLAGTGSMEDVLSNIGAMFGDFLVSMGESIIAYGIAAEAFQLAISNPVTAILAGAALVVAGSLVRSMGAEGLAEGGIVPPGFPNDTFPARLTSGETVIPAKRLPEFQGSGNEPIIMDVVISGDNLHLIQKRNNNRRNRIG
jgi:hypothetical protein